MSERRDRKKVLGQNARKMYRAQKRRAALSVLLVLFTYIAVVAIVWMEIMPDKYSVTVGEAAKETIIAIGDVVDPVQTQQQKQLARDAVADVYAVDVEKTNEITLYFAGALKNMKVAAEYGFETRGGQENGAGGYIIQYDSVRLDGYEKNELSFVKDSEDMLGENAMSKEEKIIAILDSNPDDIEKLKNWFEKRLKDSLDKGITEVNLENAKNVLISNIENGQEDIKIKKILSDMVEDSLTSNTIIDKESTEQARLIAEQNVQPVTIRKGNAIVSQDEIITQAHYDMISELGMLEESGFAYPFVIGSVGLVMVLLFIAVWYIWIFDKKTIAQPKKILLLCILILVNIIIALLLKSAGWEKMMNAAIGTVLIALLFNEQLAFVINTVISVILALFISDEAGVFTTDAIAIMISSLTGGMAAIYVCKNVRTSSVRAKMLLPGVAAGFVAMITSFTSPCNRCNNSFNLMSFGPTPIIGEMAP